MSILVVFGAIWWGKLYAHQRDRWVYRSERVVKTKECGFTVQLVQIKLQRTNFFFEFFFGKMPHRHRQLGALHTQSSISCIIENLIQAGLGIFRLELTILKRGQVGLTPTMEIAQNRVPIYRSHAKRPDCSFKLIDLNRILHSYMAISHVWGDPKTVAHLQCNEGYILPPTASAQRLVERISAIQPQFFRIDSLCIHEKDPRKKSKQLALVATICHSAKQIIAWSGWEFGYPFDD